MDDETIKVRVNFPDGRSEIADTPLSLIKDSTEIESAERVVKVDPDGRYLIIVPDYTSIDDLVHMRDSLREWWESDEKFMVIAADAKLERVEKEEK